MRTVFRCFPLIFVGFGLTFSISAPARAQNGAESALCLDGECKPAITQIRYFERDAYKLTDGKSEAVIVPSIGRIMSFKKVGGANVLWNSATPQAPPSGWANFGGDKMWLSPQSNWKIMHGQPSWPPDTAFDGQSYEVEILSGAKVRLTSPLSKTGMRLSRLIYFAANGDLVIEQTASKESGPPLRAGIWSIAQIAPASAIYLPTNAQSPYKNNFFWLGKPAPDQKIEAISPTLLQIQPQSGAGDAKIGVDAPFAAIAAVSKGTTFLLKTAKPAGDYPDGAEKSGFPVEFFINDNPKTPYCELELLAPLQNFAVGTKSTHTMRWTLHDTTSPTEIEALLQAPPSTIGK